MSFLKVRYHGQHQNKRTRHWIISSWENLFHYIWFSKQKTGSAVDFSNREMITAFNFQKTKNQFLHWWEIIHLILPWIKHIIWNINLSSAITWKIKSDNITAFHLSEQATIVRPTTLTRNSDLIISLLNRPFSSMRISLQHLLHWFIK
jgi:hypothetical protein